ncbi:hypothetical protein [Prevotella aurantiaca]
MKRLCTLFIFSVLSAVIAMAQDNPTIITKPAEGDTINLYRTTTGFESVYYYGVPHKSTGDWQRIVFGKDGAVYLENPLNSLYTKTWIKGARTVGDTIAFQLPQAIFSEEDFSTGEPKYGYLYRIHVGTKNGKETYVPIEGKENQVLKYVWRNDSLLMVEKEGEVIGMCRDNGAWTSYSEATYKSARMDENKIAPSASAKVWDGLILYMDMEGKSQLYPVKYAFDGDDVYLGDLTANVKGYWIKGTKKGTTVTFPATSYLGIDRTTACYVFVSSAVMGKGQDEMGNEYEKPCLSHQPLVFSYDAEKNALSTKGILMVHKSMDDDRSTYIFDSYRYALINQWDKKAAAPMPPKLTAYQPFDPNPWGGPGGLQFTLSYYSADFNYLDPAHLYYNLYIDGEKQTFTPETYKNLKSNMTDVPYSFSDQYQFYKYDENSRAIYFYKEAKDKVGLEAVYIDGDQRLSSGISEYFLSSTGINVNTAKQVEKVEYHDLSGRSVNRPEKGIYVQTTIYSDGSRISQKIVR